MKPNWSDAPEWADFYAAGKFWADCGNGYAVDTQITHNAACIIVNKAESKEQWGDYQERPLAITEIRAGDYIEKSELDTEEKYNEALAVFERFGFGWAEGSETDYSRFFSFAALAVESCGIFQTRYRYRSKRRLTFNQLMQLSKSWHEDINNLNIDKVASASEIQDDEKPHPLAFELYATMSRAMTNGEWLSYCKGCHFEHRLKGCVDRDKFIVIYNAYKGGCIGGCDE